MTKRDEVMVALARYSEARDHWEALASARRLLRVLREWGHG